VGVAGGAVAEVCSCFGWQSPRGSQSGLQNEYFKIKKFSCMYLTKFKLLSQIQRNTINNCDFFQSQLLLGPPVVMAGPRRQKSSCPRMGG
jgi:hypothetical protein